MVPVSDTPWIQFGVISILVDQIESIAADRSAETRKTSRLSVVDVFRTEWAF
jgi:hypothetical protein